MATVVKRLPEDMTKDECGQRADLAAANRLVALQGRNDPAYHFRMNPYDLMFREINASSLVQVDLDGRPARRTTHKSIRRGSRFTRRFAWRAKMPGR